MKNLIVSLIILFGIGAQAAPKKILVVLSSERKITLKDGVVHPTGFFLSELMVPVKGLIEAGYEPVFATPLGNAPVMDKTSDSASWFGGDEKKFLETKNLLRSLSGMTRPFRLSEIRRQDLRQYAGIFIPGGHAPMEDLLVSKDLGALLKYFHRVQKVTALICHGPIALLSALSDPNAFTEEISNGEKPGAQKWIYQDYRMTSFSTNEEQQEEPGQDNVLGGFVKFYPDQALYLAGGQLVVGGKWQSHVVHDRELITAQNPMSDVEFTKVLLEALREGK
jgi:putative intracellular protease/amidase